jgi:hypothetical protein
MPINSSRCYKNINNRKFFKHLSKNGGNKKIKQLDNVLEKEKGNGLQQQEVLRII